MVQELHVYMEQDVVLLLVGFEKCKEKIMWVTGYFCEKVYDVDAFV